MPQVPNVRDVICQPLYDTENVLAAGSSSLTFFSTPKGQSSKTYLQTNMDLAGLLPSPYDFEVRALSVQFRAGALLADTKLILDGGFLEFNVGSKCWWRSPLGMLPGGVGIYGYSQEVAAASIQANSNGVPDPRAIYTLTRTVLITQQENFNCVVTFPTAVTPSANTPMRVVLHGDLTRSVQ